MTRSPVLAIARIVLYLLALALVVVTIIPAFSVQTWWVRYLGFPRIEFFLVMLVVIALLFAFARTRTGWLAMVALLGTAVWDAIVLFPYTTIPAPEELAAASCPAGNRLRLLEVNVQMTNRHDDRLLDMVRKANPDVAWFQETNDWWKQELSGLSDTMPHQVIQTKPNYFGVELFSRLPLVQPQVKNLTSSANPSIFTGVQLPSGTVVKLYAIHPRPPQQGQSTAEGDAQLLATALAARDDTDPHVVAGDLNAPPWEDILHHAERVGRFLDPRVGRGLHITWNANSWVMKWPLDQILPGPNFTVSSIQVLPSFGSDHHPYLADLCLDPAAADRQAPPPVQPNDIASAQAAVAKGRQKAEKTGYKGNGD